MATPPFNISAEAINRIAEISVLLERHNIARGRVWLEASQGEPHQDHSFIARHRGQYPQRG